jgi:hypothetical protein
MCSIMSITIIALNMKPSNVLRFTSIDIEKEQYQQDFNGRNIAIKPPCVFVNYQIDRINDLGQIACTMTYKSKGYGDNLEEGLRRAIQNMINGVYERYLHVYAQGGGKLSDNVVDEIKIELPEPGKSLFKQLFDKSQWHILKELSH